MADLSCKKRKFIFVAVCIVLAALAILLIVTGKNRVGLNYSVKTRDVVYNSQGDLRLFGSEDCVFVYDNGKLFCHDDGGTLLWQEDLSGFSQVDFCIEKGGPLMAYDKKGTVIMAFNESGLLWKKQITGNINAVYYNSKCNVGVVSCETDTYKGVVTVFRWADNAVTDIFTKNYSSRYILGCDVSDSGKNIAVSAASGEDGTASGLVFIMDGKNGEVTHTEKSTGEVLPFVAFSEASDEIIYAAGSSKLIQIKNKESVTVKSASGGQKLISVAVGENGTCAAAFGTGDSVSNVIFCDNKGKITGEAELSENILQIASIKGKFVLCGENSLVVADKKGKLSEAFEKFEDIEFVLLTGDKTVFVTYGGGEKFGFAEFNEV